MYIDIVIFLELTCGLSDIGIVDSQLNLTPFHKCDTDTEYVYNCYTRICCNLVRSICGDYIVNVFVVY